MCRIYKKQYHRKVMLRSFNLNGKNFRISLQTQKIKLLLSTHTIQIQKCLKCFSSLNSVSDEYTCISKALTSVCKLPRLCSLCFCSFLAPISNLLSLLDVTRFFQQSRWIFTIDKLKKDRLSRS